MATNFELDNRLIAEAASLRKRRTKKAAVTQALTHYIQHLQQEREEGFDILIQKNIRISD